jgi:tetratricopeptide (TPR) repeat protein
MMRPSLRALSLLACLAVGTPAMAQETMSPADAKRIAKGHSDLARSYFESKQYDQAILEYEAAWRILPLARLLFNIAQSQRLKGDKHAALETYRRFVSQEPEGVTSDEARGHVDALTRELADEEAAARAAAQKNAAPPAVAPVAPPPAPVVVTPVAARPSEPERSRTPTYKKWWVWTIVGGVVVAGAAVGLGVGLSQSPATAPVVDTTEGTVRF